MYVYIYITSILWAPNGQQFQPFYQSPSPPLSSLIVAKSGLEADTYIGLPGQGSRPCLEPDKGTGRMIAIDTCSVVPWLTVGILCKIDDDVPRRDVVVHQ